MDVRPKGIRENLIMGIRLSKTIEELRADIFARIEGVQDEYGARGWLPGRLNLNKGIARGILEMFAWGQWQLYNFLNVVHQQAIPLEATDRWLDLHCDQIGIARKPATRARGNVLFLRGDIRGNIRIPAGRILRTLPDGLGNIYRYITDELVVLPEDAASVPVPVTSEEYGQGANAALVQICELVTPVTGIAAISNEADWLTEEGADKENDASLQRRYILEWKSKAGITRAAYEAAALSVPGVADVFVADQHPRGEGTVDVVVESTAGIPTQSLLDAVLAALDDRIVINHDLLVKSPEPLPVRIAATIEILSGDETAILHAAENWCRAMFQYGSDPNIPRFSIGRDVIRDRLAAGIVEIAGVKRIVWESPDADITVPVDGLARLEELRLATKWVDEA